MLDQLVNLTPHDITIVTPDGEVTIPASGTVARVTFDEVVIDSFSGVPVVTRKLAAVDGIPEDVPVLVSSMVLDAVPGRPNTFAPDTGKSAIRNAAGQVVAVTRLVAA